ncbi:hypothetical protein LNP27_12315 [Flavobacterium galactosidilyticum]|uniref:hypothetical protein n=1 Tax=Flavobacterium galactosidilyticum TaxID=2893886 RepID=UPI001E2D1D61|nr:hypothetical protein [Flavobacterium sp. F-340]UFH45901.1 hypothetical protein LNP27_12315 [Flavobacterium sp. F-340]
MIAQDKRLLENQFLVAEAHSLYKAKFITEVQFSEIQKAIPTPKKSKNILLRIGFAFLGMLLYASICGFISLLGLRIIDNSFTFFIFVYAAIGFIGAEFFVRQNHSEQGLDDSFLIIGQLLLGAGIGTITDGYELPVAFVATIVSLLTYLRYINRASILIFCIVSTATIAFGMFELGALGKATLPFILMLYGLAIYFICRKLTKNFQFPFYHQGILLVKYFGLILFYFAGNYLVVRELSVVLLGNEIAPNSDIPFAWFFYIFTFIVPVAYTFYGIKLFERAILWIGFLTLGFSFYTIDYYFLEVPIEIYLTSGGLLLFAIAYFSIRKLKDKTKGITFQSDRFINSSDFLHTEALILTSQFGLKPEATIDSPMEFGGGGFSGGGSSGEF